MTLRPLQSRETRDGARVRQRSVNRPMRNQRNTVKSSLAVAFLAAALAHAAFGQNGLPPIMPLDDVKPGMKGYGVSALIGPEPQQFQVEVLAVIRGWFPKGSIILARMSGPVVDEAGIISGMSGSPVFIEDKLIGAVAYGWAYTKIPLAGLTPAEEMLKVQQVDRQAQEPPPAPARAEAVRVTRRRMAELASLLTSRDRELGPDGARTQTLVRTALPPLLSDRSPGPRRVRLPGEGGIVGEIEPLPIPLAVSGAGFQMEEMLGALRGTGLMPVQAAADAGPALEEVKLQPGAPVGALLVGGDMDLSGMGTLTWIDGDNVAAFGHPLFGAGDVDLPLVLGRAQVVVPSVYRSFRLSSAERIIGRIVQDRDAAIVGRLGEEAPTFPLTVTVGGEVGDHYDYTVAGWWQTAPFFTYLTCMYSSTRWQGVGNPYMLAAEAKIAIEGREEPLMLANEFASYDVSSPAFELVWFPLSALLLNQFQEVEIKSVDYRIDVKEGFQLALIETLRADRYQAEPGSDVTLYVGLREWQGEQVVRKVPLHVPETARPGTQFQVLVCDALTNLSIEADLDPGFFAPQSFEQLLDVLARIEPNRNMVVRASFVEEGVRYAGEPLPALPPSALGIIEYSGAGEATQLISDRVKAAATPWVLEGSQMVTIMIEAPPPHKP